MGRFRILCSTVALLHSLNLHLPLDVQYDHVIIVVTTVMLSHCTSKIVGRKNVDYKKGVIVKLE